MQRPSLGETLPPRSAGSSSFRWDLEEHVGTPGSIETLDWLRKALPGLGLPLIRRVSR